MSRVLRYARGTNATLLVTWLGGTKALKGRGDLKK